MLMMNWFRYHSKTFLWIITGVVILAFVVWGSMKGSLSSGSNPDTIAVVNKQEISYSTFSEAWQNKQEAMVEAGEKISEDEEKQLKKDTLDELIEKMLLLDYAKKINITTNDEEVAQSIMNIRAFQTDNQFDQKKYFQILQSNRITTDQFENQQKQYLIVTKLKNFLMAQVKFTKDEEKNYFLKRHRKIKVKYVYFNYKNYTKDIKLTEDRIKDYYALHRKDYEKPERVKVSHILIIPDASPSSPTGLTEDAAQKLALEIIKKAKAGESFAELAKKYSRDTGSASKGGDLGWFSKGMMVPEFEKAAFALKKGEISGVVKTKFGFHVIKCFDKDTGFEPTYENTKAKIQEEMLKEEAMKIAEAKAKSLKNEINNPDDFEKASQKDNIGVLTSSWLTIDSKSKEIVSDDFNNVAFDMNLNDLSEIISGDNGYYIFKIAAEEMPNYDDKTFVKESDDLDSGLKQLKFKQLYKDFISSLKKQEKVEKFEKNL